jgi:hypothetical protein
VVWKWARDTVADWQLLNLVLDGKVSVKVVDGEMRFTAVQD